MTLHKNKYCPITLWMWAGHTGTNSMRQQWRARCWWSCQQREKIGLLRQRSWLGSPRDRNTAWGLPLLASCAVWWCPVDMLQHLQAVSLPKPWWILRLCSLQSFVPPKVCTSRRAKSMSLDRRLCQAPISQSRCRGPLCLLCAESN